jgi:hypothetical protein
VSFNETNQFTVERLAADRRNRFLEESAHNRALDFARGGQRRGAPISVIAGLRHRILAGATAARSGVPRELWQSPGKLRARIQMAG